MQSTSQEELPKAGPSGAENLSFVTLQELQGPQAPSDEMMAAEQRMYDALTSLEQQQIRHQQSNMVEQALGLRQQLQQMNILPPGEGELQQIFTYCPSSRQCNMLPVAFHNPWMYGGGPLLQYGVPSRMNPQTSAPLEFWEQDFQSVAQDGNKEMGSETAGKDPESTNSGGGGGSLPGDFKAGANSPNSSTSSCLTTLLDLEKLELFNPTSPASRGSRDSCIVLSSDESNPPMEPPPPPAPPAPPIPEDLLTKKKVPRAEPEFIDLVGDDSSQEFQSSYEESYGGKTPKLDIPFGSFGPSKVELVTDKCVINHARGSFTKRCRSVAVLSTSHPPRDGQKSLLAKEKPPVGVEGQSIFAVTLTQAAVEDALKALTLSPTTAGKKSGSGDAESVRVTRRRARRSAKAPLPHCSSTLPSHPPPSTAAGRKRKLSPTMPVLKPHWEAYPWK